MNLYDYCKEQEIEVKLACEVGFYRLKDSQIKGFIKAGTKCIVVDIILNPNDREKYCNVDFHCIGIGFEISEREIFSDHGASTYMSGINSPFIVNQGNKKTIQFARPVTTFNTIDTGTIDIISIDIEGMEWAVLCNMISLPKIIEIEMEWKKYINPYYDTIKHWMKINGYKFLERDGSDHIYIRTT